MKNYGAVIVNAGRYEDIYRVVEKLIQRNEVDFPVELHIRNGEPTYRVNAEDVIAEAEHFLRCIDSSFDNVTFDNFENFYEYANSEANMLAHNCGIALSHRNMPSDEELELCRIWNIIENLLCCLNIDDDDDSWYIPDGWKRQD